MTPGQRRILWLVCFGMTYIFWYEAGGRPLMWEANAAPTLLTGLEAKTHFWKQFGYGAFFASFGTLLTIVLRSRTQPAPYVLADGIAIALATGALIGTALRSASQSGIW